MEKLYCVLIQTCYNDDENILMRYYRKYFNKDFCDIYTLNWKNDNTDDNFYYPNITISEGLCLLVEKVPKNYEYYIFLDDDIEFKGGDPSEKILQFLLEYNPISASFDGNHTNCRIVNSFGKIRNNVYNYIKSDYDVTVYHKSVVNLLFPTIYHSSVKYFDQINFICHSLYPTKQIRYTGIKYENTRHVFTNSYNFTNKYSFNQSGLFLILKYNSLIKKNNDKYLEIIYDKVKYRERNINISKKYTPSKEKIEMTLNDLHKIFDVNHIDYLNRTSISKYNNFKDTNKNRLLSNEMDYIVIHSLQNTVNFYNKILDYTIKNDIKKYVVNCYNKNDHKCIDLILNTINTNFNICCVCPLKKEDLKNIKWFDYLYKIFNINQKFNEDDTFKLYNYKNLKLLMVDNDYLNENEDKILKILF